jgi:alpha-ribazole phosphatase
MTVTTRWWWIRHAPVRGHGGRLYGQNDVACDTSDATVFEALAARLPPKAVWIATPLKRTQQTARALAQAMRAQGAEAPEPLIEPAFIEQNFGAWQGRTYAEIEASMGWKRGKFWLAPARATPPGGESFAAVAERVGAAIGRLSQTHAGRDIVAVAHGGTIHAALALALAVEAGTALHFAVDLLSLTRIDHIDRPAGGGAWRVVTVNQPTDAAPAP